MHDEPYKKAFLLTSFGCQMNVADSQRIRGILSTQGFFETQDDHEADLILFNTCCVRKHAEQRFESRVRQLKAMKDRKKGLIIAIGGCLAQQQKDKLLERLPMVDVVFGPNDIETLPEILLRFKSHGEQTGAFSTTANFNGERSDGVILKRPFSAFVNVIRGCTNFCTYCVVPLVRGPEVSRPLSEIVAYIGELSLRGVTEVTLLGQNVNAYGNDLGHKNGFATLLEALESVENLKWIRFLTSHPRDFDYETLQRISKLKKVCEQFHLPLQSGSNRILASMNRGYTRDSYLQLVKNLRELIPSACVTTDIICGFPTETEEDFEDTLDIVRNVRYEGAYMYYYSPRQGTSAAYFPGQLEESVRKERLARLISVQNEISVQESRELIGKTFEVLVEERIAKAPEFLKGKTRTGRAIDFTSAENLVGRYVSVGVESARNWTLSGKLK